MTALAVVFWAAVGLLAYTHLGYPAVLWLLARSRPDQPWQGSTPDGDLPRVSLIVAAPWRWITRAIGWR